jgi:hypothetical protein
MLIFHDSCTMAALKEIDRMIDNLRRKIARLRALELALALEHFKGCDDGKAKECYKKRLLLETIHLPAWISGKQMLANNVIFAQLVNAWESAMATNGDFDFESAVEVMQTEFECNCNSVYDHMLHGDPIDGEYRYCHQRMTLYKGMLNDPAYIWILGWMRNQVKPLHVDDKDIAMVRTVRVHN